MADPVKSRTYRSLVRAEQARRTQRSILAAARRLFTDRGYAATTMHEIASDAGVALDTVYAAVGPKAVLFRLLLETAISGTDEAVPADERDYVRRIRSEPRARHKLEIYAEAVCAISERRAPLDLVLRDASTQAPELAEIRDEISTRRATNMRRLALDLLATGDLRPELTADEIADVIWSTNSAEFYQLLVNDR